ncbi:MAG: hypothetical protein QY317_16205 [Candidatus Jettenia caeni]|nr:MAG: hypothetical protein QY317_16205 [Candidatus Jettenia caeni]
MATEPEIVLFPSSLTAGTTLRFQRSYAKYPASAGWAYTFYLAGSSVLSASGVANGDAFIITLTATNTANLAEGTYRYTEIVSKDDVKYEVGRGVLPVSLNLATALAGAAQTHAEKTLSVIEAALSGRLTSDLESYQIAGRSVNKIPVKELLQLRGHYASLVWRQRNPGRLGPQVEVCFGGSNSLADISDTV